MIDSTALSPFFPFEHCLLSFFFLDSGTHLNSFPNYNKKDTNILTQFPLFHPLFSLYLFSVTERAV